MRCALSWSGTNKQFDVDNKACKRHQPNSYQALLTKLEILLNQTEISGFV